MNESFYVVEAQVACTLSANDIRIYGLDSDPVMFYPSSPAVGKREITTLYVTWLHQIDR